GQARPASGDADWSRRSSAHQASAASAATRSAAIARLRAPISGHPTTATPPAPPGHEERDRDDDHRHRQHVDPGQAHAEILDVAVETALHLTQLAAHAQAFLL